MLRPIESMRILRAKMVSLGGAALRSCPQAAGPQASWPPAQSPTRLITAATLAQRVAIITLTSLAPRFTPAIPHPAPVAWQALAHARRLAGAPQPAQPRAQARAPSTPTARPAPD